MTTINPASGTDTGVPENRRATNPLPADDVYARLNRSEEVLTRAEGLVLALQTLLWDFTQDTVSADVGRKRQALVALGDALEALVVSDPPESVTP